MSTTPNASVSSQINTQPRSQRRWYIIAAVILIIGGGALYLILTRGEVSTNDAQIDGRLVPVALTCSR